MNTSFLTQGIFLVLIISGLPLIISSISSILLAFLQTITQIQEQSLSYIVKCIAVFVSFYVCFDYFYELITKYFHSAFEEVVKQGLMSL